MKGLLTGPPPSPFSGLLYDIASFRRELKSRWGRLRIPRFVESQSRPELLGSVR